MRKTLLTVLMALAVAAGIDLGATGWPAKYEGVMLQGFYWDSYSDTRWSRLENQADELAASFSLIWVPNSAKSQGNPTMGYMPIYWFTNHNSSFGTETQLRSMISTLKAKSVGVIADVVVNHRVGVSSWTDFPAEKWNGNTWKLGPEHICSTDEVRNQPGQPAPTGAPDTGEDFNGARDLDHTSPVVQNHVKNYVSCLLNDFGYTGVRYDMVKGFAGRFIKTYNQYAQPQFSVGEYWDGNYDAVAAWIEATGRESAAFDFPGKYAINEAFHSNDLTKLVWKANGTTPQPAGLIHFGYAQYAVTFVDNHDTYRDGSKFNGNVLAANAFIICSPGTPCVFLPHWREHKTAIQSMIAVRKAAGVNNTSEVTVLKTTRDCYMARVKGTRGELAVRIGSTADVPEGYSAADVRASGNGYCIWSKTGVTPDPDPDPDPDPQPGDMTIYFDNSLTNWSTVKIHYWGTSGTTWPGVDMARAEGNIWKYTVPEGTIGVVFNAGLDQPQTADVTDLTDGHLYRPLGNTGKPECEDLGIYGTSVTAPEALYVLGDLKGAHWVTSAGLPMTRNNAVFTADNIEFEAAPGQSTCYFNLSTALGADWDALNEAAHRFGPVSEGVELTSGTPAEMKLYDNGVDASACKSWCLTPGVYNLVADFNNGTITATSVSSGVFDADITADDIEPVYYNLQGVRVNSPANGIYIEVRGTTARRILVP